MNYSHEENIEDCGLLKKDCCKFKKLLSKGILTKSNNISKPVNIEGIHLKKEKQKC